MSISPLPWPTGCDDHAGSELAWGFGQIIEMLLLIYELLGPEEMAGRVEYL